MSIRRWRRAHWLIIIIRRPFIFIPIEPPDGITPTIGFANAEFTMNRCKVTVYDLGGGVRIRDVWRKYYAEVALIFFTSQCFYLVILRIMPIIFVIWHSVVIYRHKIIVSAIPISFELLILSQFHFNFTLKSIFIILWVIKIIKEECCGLIGFVVFLNLKNHHC